MNRILKIAHGDKMCHMLTADTSCVFKKDHWENVFFAILNETFPSHKRALVGYITD